MRQVTRRAERNRTIVINPDDLKDIVPAKQATKENNEIENKFIEALKEYINTKMTISAEQTEVAVKQVLNFIDLIKEEKDTNTDIQLQSGIGGNDYQSEHLKPSSEQPRRRIVSFNESANQVIYIEAEFKKPQINDDNDNDNIDISEYSGASSNQPLEEDSLVQQSSIDISAEIINSSIKIQDKEQSIQKSVDRVVNTNVCCTKSDIIQERTFNFQSLLSIFENK